MSCRSLLLKVTPGLLFIAGTIVGCSGQPPQATCNSNSVDASAGADPCGTGGASARTGGSAATGGTTETGGAPTTGGRALTGGMPSTGGAATGGDLATGGAATGGAATGGDLGTGGNSCPTQCTIGKTQCNGNQIQTCAAQPNGCSDWSVAVDCGTGQICSADQCSALTAGMLRCNGTVVERFDGSQWSVKQVCAQGCDPSANACTGVSDCSPGDRRCTGNQAEVCNSSGSAWLPVESCAHSCAGGLCTGGCTPSVTRCNGDIPETCNLIGTSWIQSAACSTYCAKGACAEASITIDSDTTATMQGEHYIQNVVIKNGAKLTVPTGQLIIHAKSFNLDATSQIVVTPTGTDSRGQGSTGGCSSCYTSGTYCGSTIAYACWNASGGSYGTRGGPSILYGEYNGCVCSSTFNAKAPWAAADTEFAPGSAGGGNDGTCSPGGSGGKGGGVLVVYADVIQIDGVIYAVGQNGGGCGGGGSGGLVALIGTTYLGVTGSISVSGGAGGANGGAYGGSGVVKLLYGEAQSITGSIGTPSFQSLAPPLDIASMTHPDPTRWYNDDFPAVELAWSRPSSSVIGYYTLLNTTKLQVPSAGSGSVLGDEAVLFPAASLAAGTNYFHTSSNSSLVGAGTVEARYAINVNATAPYISSTTHPSSTTWYTSLSPYFQWTLPHAAADVTNFYWVFDAYPTTIPNKTSNKIPMNVASPASSESLALSNQAAGFWYFHLIAEDTVGNLTKAASHYRVQLGPDPGTGSLWGTVTDATTTAGISGATVTLNRGLITMNTDASGAFAFPNAVTVPSNAAVVAQSYEVKASKQGYGDATATAVVTKGNTTWVYLTLSP